MSARGERGQEPVAPKDAEPGTRRLNQALATLLPFDDTSDFEDARRGFIGTHDSGVIRSASGTVLSNLPAYRFLNGADAPTTVNPSLWRIARRR